MRGEEMTFLRTYPDEDGHLFLPEGTYGKDPDGIWYIRFQGENADLTGNLTKHDVIEHDDGTITVSPSILCLNAEHRVHGYLERGIWRDV